jgi:drug/metabolite transporter (DMT)-like permease
MFRRGRRCSSGRLRHSGDRCLADPAAANCRPGLRAVSPMGHVWRGFVGTCAMGLGFAGLGYLPLPEVTAIGYAAPLLTVIFAAMFLGEDVRLFRLSCVALGMVGVLIVLSPRLTVLDGGAGPCRGLRARCWSWGARSLPRWPRSSCASWCRQRRPPAIVFYFSLTATILSLVTLPFGWVWPSPTELALLIGAGLWAGGADPADVQLPRGGCLARRALRLCVDALCPGHRLVRLCRGADRDDARRVPL